MWDIKFKTKAIKAKYKNLSLNGLKIISNYKNIKLPLKKTEKMLNNLLLYIESIKDNINIDEIYGIAGDKLLEQKISSLFTVFDNQKQTITIKRYYSAEQQDSFMDQVIGPFIVDKKIELNKLSLYKRVYQNKRASFCRNRTKQAVKRHSEIKDELESFSKLNSILAPFVVRGEIVGSIEVFANFLQPNHVKIFEKFSDSLAKIIVNTILYQEVKKSELRYRNLFERANEGFAIFNSQKNIFAEVNNAFCKLSSYTPDEIKQIHFLRLFSREYREKTKAYINKRINQPHLEIPSHLETKIITKYNKKKFVSLMINETTNKSEWFFIINDISQRKEAEIKLKKSEEKYREVIEGTDNLVTRVDKNGKFIFVNSAAKKYFGMTADACLGKSSFYFVHPADRNKTTKTFINWQKNKISSASFENRQIGKDGKIWNIVWTVKFHYDSQGEIAYINSIGRDITEHKKLETKLVEAKSHYKQVIDAMRDAICVIDNEFRIISYNKKFAQKVNFPLNKLKFQPYKKIISRYEHKNYIDFCCRNCKNKCIIDKVFETGLSLSEEEISHDKEGNEYVHLINVFPKKNKQGKTYQVVITFRNISERKKAEKRIKELSKFNQKILDTAPISIVVLNNKGVIVAANDQAKKLMAKSNKKLIGRNLLDTKEIKNNQKILNNYKNLLAKGETFYYDNLAYKNSDKKTDNFLNIIAVPLYDGGNNIEGAVSMALDNTETILAKKKLRDLNKNLEKKVLLRTKELNLVNKKLSKALDLKLKFISDASHELRTPLTVIQGNLDLAIQETKISKYQIPEVYLLLQKEVEQMTNILSDLTLLTNADSHKELFEHEPIDTNMLISAVVQSLNILARQKKIKINFKPLAKNIIITGDETKLEKLLINIVRNAIKYTDNNGLIKIWLKKINDKINFYIEDNGVGIPKEDLPYIFERFYRVDKARTRQEGGTGLGLSIGKMIVEAHHGEIKVKSKLQKGTLFTVSLPIKHVK